MCKGNFLVQKINSDKIRGKFLVPEWTLKSLREIFLVQERTSKVFKKKIKSEYAHGKFLVQK